MQSPRRMLRNYVPDSFGPFFFKVLLVVDAMLCLMTLVRLSEGENSSRDFYVDSRRLVPGDVLAPFFQTVRKIQNRETTENRASRLRTSL
jgi:hypothetical protein